MGKFGTFRFSPDGQKIALIAAAEVHDPLEGRLRIAPAIPRGPAK